MLEFDGTVGHGIAAYRAASSAVLDWRVLEHAAWAGIRADAATPASIGAGAGTGGRGVCTFARCYGGLVWAVNPCRCAQMRLCCRGCRAHACESARSRGAVGMAWN